MVVVRGLRILLDFFRKGSIAIIFLSKYYLLGTSIGNTIYSIYKDLKYDTGFRNTEIDFFRTTVADPDQIKYKINQNSFGYQYTQMGRIETGDFPAAAVRFEHYYVYTSLYDHFVNGAAWSETAYYTMAFDQVDATDLGWSQIPDYETLETFFANLDDLYESLSADGYLTYDELNQHTGGGLFSFIREPINAHDEVFIDIGRNGELLLTDGRHRTAMAKILSLDAIPVRILARHREWCGFRHDLLQAIRSDASGMSKYPIAHPEFEHLESHYEPEPLVERIVSVVDPGQGPIVEFDPGVSGTLLCELAKEGYEVIAVVTDSTHKRYLKWYAEFQSVSLSIRDPAELDETLSDCTLIALDPVDRIDAAKCIDRTDAGQVITTDKSSYQDRFDETVAYVEIPQ